MRRDAFQAIADPTRRGIIHLLAHGPLNLNAVAANFDISRPAISKHMKILTECGLVVIHPDGRERLCEANLRSLAEVSQWVEKYRAFWTARMDALENFLNDSTGNADKVNTAAGGMKKAQKRKNNLKSVR